MKKQYAVLQAITTSELERLVNDRLTRGWELYGNLIFDGKLFIQALTYAG